jgi:RND family efflux transporter MFP subunit
MLNFLRDPALVELRLSLVAFLAVCTLSSCAQPEQQVAPAVMVEVMQIGQGQSGGASLSADQSYIGRVEAGRVSQAGFDLGGTLTQVLVNEGDQVRRGQALATIDAMRSRAAASEAEAGLNEARASRDLARSTYERLVLSEQIGGASKQQLQEAKSALSSSEASVQRLEASLSRIKVDTQKSTLRALISGQVTRRLLDEGQVVSPGQPVIEITQDDQRKIRVAIASMGQNQLSTGDRLRISLGDQSSVARVDSLSSVLNAQSQTTDLLLDLPSELNARPGDLVRVFIPTIEEPGSLVLPLESLSETVQGLWSVYVIEPEASGESGASASNGVARRVPVVITRQSDSLVEVSGPLKSGDVIIANGVHRVVPGQQVRFELSKTRASSQSPNQSPNQASTNKPAADIKTNSQQSAADTQSSSKLSDAA